MTSNEPGKKPCYRNFTVAVLESECQSMRTSNVIMLIGAVVLVVLLLALFGGGMMGWGWGMSGPGHMWGWNGGTWWSFGMMLGMLLFWLLIIAGLVFGISLLMRGDSTDRGRAGDDRQQPLDILRERYARGEISREEFEQMRRDLE
jgi:putative membrane protein